jgi:hypothetical protein
VSTWWSLLLEIRLTTRVVRATEPECHPGGRRPFWTGKNVRAKSNHGVWLAEQERKARKGDAALFDDQSVQAIDERRTPPLVDRYQGPVNEEPIEAFGDIDDFETRERANA